MATATDLKLPISADSHIVGPPNCYVDYIDPAWRDQAPHIVRNDQGTENFVIEGLSNPIPIGMLAAAGMTPEEVKVMRPSSRLRRHHPRRLGPPGPDRVARP